MKSPEPTAKGNKLKKIVQIFNKKWIKVIAVILALVIVAVIAMQQLSKSVQTSMNQISTTSTGVLVERRDININISSSGIVEPLDTYNVTTLVEGEIIAADFEEGDRVEKDQILYQVDTDSIDSKIDSASKSIGRAERQYNSASKDLNQSNDLYDDLKVKASAAGQIVELTVEAGEIISAGVPIGKITDNNTMLLKIPFNSAQVGIELIGKTAVIQMEETLETLFGTVIEINPIEYTLSGGRLVKMVTIEVANPGGLTAEHVATAVIDQITCSDTGTFEPAKEKSIIAKSSGEVVALHVKKGDMVAKDQVLLSLDKKGIDKQVDGYKSGVDSAKDSVEDAKTALEDLQENLDNFQIKAPISGQIINKKVKVGDKITPSNISILTVIYDMSAFRFKMSIDELDIMKVLVGQEVSVTADALSGIEMKGYVENISLESTNTNGIAQYPVTIRMDDIGKLLPGMTVNGEIMVGNVTNVLTVPSLALMRGNVVYIKDDTVTAAVGEVPVGYREVKVEVGVSSDDYVEIKGGLSEGDEIYVKQRESQSFMDMYQE